MVFKAGFTVQALLGHDQVVFIERLSLDTSGLQGRFYCNSMAKAHSPEERSEGDSEAVDPAQLVKRHRVVDEQEAGGKARHYGNAHNQEYDTEQEP